MVNKLNFGAFLFILFVLGQASAQVESPADLDAVSPLTKKPQVRPLGRIVVNGDTKIASIEFNKQRIVLRRGVRMLPTIVNGVQHRFEIAEVFPETRSEEEKSRVQEKKSGGVPPLVLDYFFQTADSPEESGPYKIPVSFFTSKSAAAPRRSAVRPVPSN